MTGIKASNCWFSVAYMTAMVSVSALLSAALLLLLPGTSTQSAYPEHQKTFFQLEVNYGFLDKPLEKYGVSAVFRGILMGAMENLTATNQNFKYSWTPNVNYGPYLDSVNGVPGRDEDHTYWQLLVKKPNGTQIRPDVGIGCYIPEASETVILEFSKW